MSERGPAGERGQRGDHGQHGDEGAEGRAGEKGEVGRTGETGQVGRTGETGHTGQAGRPGDVGEPGKTGRRGRSNWQAYLMMGAAMLAALVVFLLQDTRRQADTDRAVRANDAAIEAIEREGRERRDQTCEIFENQHLEHVKNLRSTYRYLRTLPKSEYGTTLVKAILRGLPATEREARTDQAPDYCDEPGVKAEKAGADPIGLPEPDPRVPRKRNFSDRAQRP